MCVRKKPFVRETLCERDRVCVKECMSEGVNMCVWMRKSV